MSSLDQVLPFLRGIDDLLEDPAITEVMVNNGGARVFVERDGQLSELPDRHLEATPLTLAIKHIARACGDEISEESPVLDARLENGPRVAAMLPPCAVDGPVLTVRRFPQRLDLVELVARGTLDADLAAFLRATVCQGHTVLVSGGTGTGKTTVLNALANQIPADNRVVLIEETTEVQLELPNLVRFEARQARPPVGQERPLAAVTIADLLRAALRHRPDRIVVGEVRGAEAFDLLQALNTGHRGSVTTIHASSARGALTRLTHCVLLARTGLAYAQIEAAVTDAIDVVVHLSRDNGQRRVAEVLTRNDNDTSAGHALRPRTRDRRSRDT